ncbi:MAG: hypothetical protein JWN40_4880 [Phycisphaerales bacterium]|nr:hypothetical protein [Phycisphaerales bacterium]
MRITTSALLIIALLNTPACFAAPADAAPQPTEDAAALYLRAAKMRKADSPAETNLEYRDFPPFPKEWHAASEAAWEANAPVRDLVRKARSLDKAAWPEGNDATYLNDLRGLTNNIADAALHESVHGRAAAAFEFARDELHLADLLEEKPSKNVLRLLVGCGITASACNRLLVITSNVPLTSDEKNTVDLNVATARQIIIQLLDQRIPKDQLTEILGPEGSPGWKDPNLAVDRLIETINRANADRTFAAMSLACHLYFFDKQTWQTSLDQLVPAYLPKVPIDPWGDGKQTFGYALIKAALPDGADRPLVYNRCRSTDGLLYRLDEPQYGFYQGDGTQLPPNQRKQGGQFRDVTAWQPRPLKPGDPTVKPLP